jgi:hypothetical protein
MLSRETCQGIKLLGLSKFAISLLSTYAKGLLLNLEEQPFFVAFPIRIIRQKEPKTMKRTHLFALILAVVMTLTAFSGCKAEPAESSTPETSEELSLPDGQPSESFAPSPSPT